MFVGDVDLPKEKRAPSSSIVAMKVTTIAAVYYLTVVVVVDGGGGAVGGVVVAVECIADSVAASVAMESIPTTTEIEATVSIQ